MSVTEEGLVSAVRKSNLREYWRRQNVFHILTILPAMIALFGVIGYPLVRVLAMSFTDYTLTDPTWDFVGLENYIAVANDPVFWGDLWRTILYAGGSVILQVIFGLGIAQLLNKNIRGRGFLRGAFLLPWIIPSVVIGFLAMWVFNSQYGILNFFLVQIGLIDGFLGWFRDPDLAMPVVMIASSWKGFPFIMVVLLAGLQTIPQEQIEAAKIDGANRIYRFIHVTLPNLRNLIMLVSLLQFIWYFQFITIIWVTTKGGPINATETLPVFIYQLSFTQYRMSYAAAVGGWWLIFLAIFGYLYVRVVGSSEF